LKGRCTLIENIPIVARSAEVSPTDAILSSIVGYYERQFPILGPPQPKRVQQLFSLTVATQKDMDDARRDAFSAALYGLEASTFKSFRDVARAHLGESDGAVRGYFLRTLERARVDETLQRVARDRFQTVKVERIGAVSFAAMKNAVAGQKPAVLSVGGGKYVYAVVGYFEPEALAIVIDSDAAKPLRVPAERVLITEQDRKSSGKFATRAREKLKGETLLFDGRTSCLEQRPAGLKFLNPSKLGGGTDLYVILEWALDLSRMQEFIRVQGTIQRK
jgi:hypothetical protein